MRLAGPCHGAHGRLAAHIRVVGERCEPLLRSSSWFASRKDALAAALLSAPAAGGAYHSVDPSLAEIVSCGGVLDDGLAAGLSMPVAGQASVVIRAPVGGRAHLLFDSVL